MRSSAWHGGGRASSVLLQGVALALVARLLPAPVFGDFSAAFALAWLVGAATEFGLTNTTVLELNKRRADGRVVAECAVAGLGLAAVGAAVTIPLAWALFPADARAAFLFLLPWAVTSRLVVAGTAYGQYRLRFARLAVAELVGRGSTVVLLAAVPVASTTLELAWIGAAFLAGNLVVIALAFPSRLARGAMDRKVVRDAARLLAVAAPLGLVSALSLIHVRVDHLVLEGFGLRRSLGDYAIAYRVVEGLVAVLGVGAVIAFSLMARTAGGDRSRISRSATPLVVALAAGGVAVAALFAPAWVAVLGGAEHAAAVPLLRVLAVVVAVSLLNMMPALTVVAESRATALLPIAGAALAANLLLNVILVPLAGVNGSVAATVVTEMLGLWLCCRRAEAVRPGSQRPALLAIGAGGALMVAIGPALLPHGGEALGRFAAVALYVMAVGVAVGPELLRLAAGERRRWVDA